jgi:predicted RNase H-like HicB family nuclease
VAVAVNHFEEGDELMTGDVELRAFIRRDSRSRWIAVCPRLDVVTQGTSAAEAKRHLDDAVHAWFDDCIERGTLDQALRECGFHPATWNEGGAAGDHVTLSRDGEADVRVDVFSVHVTIRS